MKQVPTVIIEEHHEAFLAWHHTRLAGKLSATGNVLLHVDSHSDMAQPELSHPICELEDSAGEIETFTYGELDIASFIVPAIYQGLINDVYWLHPLAKQEPRVHKAYVRTHREEGKVFLTGTDSAWAPDHLLQDRKVYTITSGKINEVELAAPPTILDIDLDYFSCAKGNGRGMNLEVTKSEYERYQNDRYHCLRIERQGVIVEKNGRYFLKRPQRIVERLDKRQILSEDEILERMDAFIRYLSDNDVAPQVITVCRSGMSGYTPSDQVEFIENALLARLPDLYSLDVRPIDSIWSNNGHNGSKGSA